MEKPYVSKNLIYLRKKCNLTPAKLGELLSVSESSIKKIESGKPDRIHNEKLNREIAHYFGVPYDYYINEDFEKILNIKDTITIDEIIVRNNTILPLIVSDSALEDKYFKTAYYMVQNYLMYNKEAYNYIGKLNEDKLDKIFDLYELSYANYGTIESLIHQLIVFLHFYSSIVDEKKLNKLVNKMNYGIKKFKIFEMMQMLSLGHEAIDYRHTIRKQMYNHVMDYMKKIKEDGKYIDFVDYYKCLLIFSGFLSPNLSADYYCDIGMESLMMEKKIGNKYAIEFFNYLSG